MRFYSWSIASIKRAHSPDRFPPPHAARRLPFESLMRRVVFLLAGLGIAAFLIWRADPRLVVAMFVRVGGRVPIVAAIYAAYLATRAFALERSVPNGQVTYADMLRIRLSGEAIEQLTLTGPFFAEPTKGWLLTRLRQRAVRWSERS